jgi:hypothetical protein
MNNNDLTINVFIDKRKIKKADLFIDERKNIVNQLFEIIQLRDDGGVKYFYSDDLTEDKEIKIIELKDEIKKYFKVGAWTVYKSTIKIDNIALSLIKNVLKHESIEYVTSKKMIGGISKTKYTIILNNQI